MSTRRTGTRKAVAKAASRKSTKQPAPLPIPDHVRQLLRQIIAPEMPVLHPPNPVYHAHLEQVRRIVREDPHLTGIASGVKVVDGERTGQPCICFFFRIKRKHRGVRPGLLVPPVLATAEGHAVFTDVQVMGPVKLHAAGDSPALQPGRSVGLAGKRTGTLGAVVRRENDFFILSNSHVLGERAGAQAGAAVYCPSEEPTDWMPGMEVARYSTSVKLVPGGAANLVNPMDAALAKLLVDPASIAVDGPWSQPPDTAEPYDGMAVELTGRSSTHAIRGVVRHTDLACPIRYDDQTVFGFCGQVACTLPTKPGDSGSMVVEAAGRKRVVGMHIGKTDCKRSPGDSGNTGCKPALNDGAYTIFTPISAVLGMLQVTLAVAPAAAG